MKPQFFITLIVFVLFRCSNIPSEVTNVLNNTNNIELQKVIKHYEELGDKEKLKAAYFLIGNMGNKYSTVWHNRQDYQELFDFAKTGASNNPIKEKWDSLKRRFSVVTEKIKDIDIITAKYLIQNIDQAFDVWKNTPWGKHYNFEQFCEHILPYRVQDEPLDNWRSFLYDQMKDSLKNISTMREACKYINDYIHRHHRILPVLSDMPKLATIDGYKNPAGICEHRFILLINMLRAFGIPCSIDYTPQFTNWAGGHLWLALVDTAYLNEHATDIKGQLAQHVEIATEYIEWLTGALQELYPNLTDLEASGLALRGLNDMMNGNPNYWNSLIQSFGFRDTNNLLSVTDTFRDQTDEKGTPCD